MQISVAAQSHQMVEVYSYERSNSLQEYSSDLKGRESVAQYILRNSFSVEKMTYNDENGKVICRSKMTHGKNKNIFIAYTAEEFIAAITQHIPEKWFQMVRYMRGTRTNQEGCV